MNFVYKKQKRELVLAEDDILDAQYWDNLNPIYPVGGGSIDPPSIVFFCDSSISIWARKLKLSDFSN